jgi:hypothetical protein
VATWGIKANSEMKTSIYVVLVAVILLIVVSGSYFKKEEPVTVGGERDEHGCLVAGGSLLDLNYNQL